MSSQPIKQIIPARHPWRVVGGVLVLFIAAVVVQSIAFNPRWEWGVFRQWFLTR